VSNRKAVQAARTAFFAAREMATDALAPLADDDADLERLLDLAAIDGLAAGRIGVPGEDGRSRPHTTQIWSRRSSNRVVAAGMLH
jgi:hypothetical protein